MKRFLALVLAALTCLSFCACGSDVPATQEKEGEETQTANDAFQKDYDNVTAYLKNKDYDAAINYIKQMQKDAVDAETESMGVEEITITVENWDKYFEFGYTQDYYFNSFEEITHINCATGFKLKDGYQMVLNDNDRSTKIAFEAELEPYTADVTYDFKAGTFSVGPSKEEGRYGPETETTTFTPNVYSNHSKQYPPTGVRGIGGMWQGAADDGAVQEETFRRISKVLRAEGTLYLYKK